MRKGENQPLVVSSCARGGAGASRIAAQFIIYIFPLSARCDLKREVEVYKESQGRSMNVCMKQKWKEHWY